MLGTLLYIYLLHGSVWKLCAILKIVWQTQLTPFLELSLLT